MSQLSQQGKLALVCVAVCLQKQLDAFQPGDATKKMLLFFKANEF